ncbi:MAG: ElyC/SanA/YdcF family protein [Rubripirellula sp.]
MTDDKRGLIESRRARRWRLAFWLSWFVFAIIGFATSIPTVRGWLIAPLHVHDAAAQGDVAYVMADGPAVWERLRAASDLFHEDRVSQIYLLREDELSSFNYVRHQKESRLQREIDYLGLFGVPADRIESVEVDRNDWLSSRSEAVGLARKLRSPTRIVVVTSSPHTRRSQLCFRRAFGPDDKIAIYAASEPSESSETFSPIWIEYAKLLVYWICV